MATTVSESSKISYKIVIDANSFALAYDLDHEGAFAHDCFQQSNAIVLKLC